jgi:hypothetical protein
MTMTVVNETSRKVQSLFVDNTGALKVTSGGGGGGGAVTIADGADVTEGAIADAAVAAGATGSVSAKLRAISRDIGTMDADTSALAAVVETPKDSTGLALPQDFETLAQTLSYTGAVLNTVAKTNGVNTWTQTLGYTGDNLTSVSQWVKT